MEAEVKTEKVGFLGKCLKVERAVCATGTAWGLLKGYPTWVLLAYWLARHLVYGTAAVLLIIYIPGSVIGVGVFFFFIRQWRVLPTPLARAVPRPPAGMTRVSPLRALVRFPLWRRRVQARAIHNG
jgi:hypothetical protein